MKEHYIKKVNVLGIDVCVMRPDRAVNLTMELMREQVMNKVFFLSADGSLFCQNAEWARDYVNSLQLVFTGDHHMDVAVTSKQETEGTFGGIGKFADDYFKKLLGRVNREHKEVFVVSHQQESLDALQHYIDETFPNISFEGMVYEGESAGETDKVVNEINGHIPDVVFFCLPFEQQLQFMRDYDAMMNTKLCICIESLLPLVRKETESVPGWVEKLHLDGLYHWGKGDRRLQRTIGALIFRKKMQDDTGSDSSSK